MSKTKPALQVSRQMKKYFQDRYADVTADQTAYEVYLKQMEAEDRRLAREARFPASKPTQEPETKP